MSQQINLFNPIFLKKKRIFGALPMLQALAVILLGALALGGYAQFRVGELERRAAAGKVLVEQREARLVKVAAQFQPRQANPALAEQLARAELLLKSLREADAVLHNGRLGNTDGYAEYFRALARQNVGGLWLTGVTIVGAGHDIGVQGRAMQATLIPNYIARLNAEKVMRGKTFASLRIERATFEPAPAVPAPAPISAPLANLAGIGAAAAASAAAAAAQAPAPAPVVAGAKLAPFVEFSLQSSEPEAAK
ncbi:MSHA biogenesis protein MshI [Rugamonas sp. CCM 8940]|uniref:MSHA biogenesis protein MshI n=1 Tax=Rugamonas sp. CCM 8940 TaxID=2765359 RepID=UPI0018F76F6C|nr:MSHA biogenesis protein MshI [Rugamonas sp. CCM 8940]MBJ7313581.1 MSHA biogenesis protein MshI [Rugamonas sp. CCM 8940]